MSKAESKNKSRKPESSKPAAKTATQSTPETTPEARFFAEAAYALTSDESRGLDLAQNVETAYIASTKGMSAEARKGMITRISSTMHELAEGFVSSAKSTDMPPENQRYWEELLQQSAQARAKNIAEKKLLPPALFQQYMGISKQAVSKAVRENRFFAVMGPSGENYYPAFFSDEKYNRRHLEKICKVLGDLPGGSKWDFFTTAKFSLDAKTPLEALAEGKLDAVMFAAAGFAAR